MLAVRKIATITLTLLAVMGSSGCGKLTLSIPLGSGVIDFLKTEILTGGSNLANGIAEMIILIHLKNSDNTIVADYKPTFTVSIGTGVTIGECSKSSSDGVSVCVLKSTAAGSKILKLTNALVGLEKTIEFVASADEQIFGIAAGARKGMTTGLGHKINLSAGESPKGHKSVTAGGYKVSTGVGTTADSF